MGSFIEVFSPKEGLFCDFLLDVEDDYQQGGSIAVATELDGTGQNIRLEVCS